MRAGIHTAFRKRSCRINRYLLTYLETVIDILRNGCLIYEFLLSFRPNRCLINQFPVPIWCGILSHTLCGQPSSWVSGLLILLYVALELVIQSHLELFGGWVIFQQVFVTVQLADEALVCLWQTYVHVYHSMFVAIIRLRTFVLSLLRCGVNTLNTPIILFSRCLHFGIVVYYWLKLSSLLQHELQSLLELMHLVAFVLGQRAFQALVQVNCVYFGLLVNADRRRLLAEHILQ